jgi:nicotinamidase-related amidase
MRNDLMLERTKALLLVIDFQEKLLAAFTEPGQMLQNCVKLIKFAKILNLPILWTEQYPKGLGQTTDAIKGELSDVKPVEKSTFSCFGEPDFVDTLFRYTSSQIIVCGIETHICVEQTVLDGIECGYQMHVVTDACGSRKTQDHNQGVQKMKTAGASLNCTEMAIYEVLVRSDTKEFRETLKFLK